MKNLYILAILVLTVVNNLHAQFSGGYAPPQWNTSLSSGSNGSINSSGAPASVIINGSDAGAGSDINTDYTIAAISPGIWSFHWVYHTNDADPSYDYAGIIINGSFIKLSNDVGPNDQSGNYTAAYVNVGTVIGFRVQSTDNIGGNATLTISSFSPPGGVLPVKLTSFTATQKQSKVELQWSVGEEMNTAGYLVQHSIDGIHFTNIATVAAQHFQNYTIVDGNPANAVNYYRLQVTDNDGSIAYSQIASIKLDLYSKLSVCPNPAHDKTIISIASPRAMEETIRIYNASGRMVHVQKVNLLQGINAIQFDLSSFNNGIYFTKFEKSGSTATVARE